MGARECLCLDKSGKPSCNCIPADKKPSGFAFAYKAKGSSPSTTVAEMLNKDYKKKLSLRAAAAGKVDCSKAKPVAGGDTFNYKDWASPKDHVDMLMRPWPTSASDLPSWGKKKSMSDEL